MFAPQAAMFLAIQTYPIQTSIASEAGATAGLDTDKMDYLARDAHHVGMKHAVSIDGKFLQQHSAVHKGKIVYERSDGVYSRLNSVFTCRAQMHARVYQSTCAPAACPCRLSMCADACACLCFLYCFSGVVLQGLFVPPKPHRRDHTPCRMYIPMGFPLVSAVCLCCYRLRSWPCICMPASGQRRETL